MNYQDYHTNPINKLIHFICIPFIVITSINFITYYDLNLYNLIYYSLMIYYYNYYRYTQFITMIIYYLIANHFSKIWKTRISWMKESIIIFIFAWIFQFIGHYIEGNRPALVDSITTAITEAPLFSIMYLF